MHNLTTFSVAKVAVSLTLALTPSSVVASGRRYSSRCIKLGLRPAMVLSLLRIRDAY